MKIKHSPILSGWSCLEATQPQERKAVQLYVSLASKHVEESGSLRGGWGDEADHRRLRLGSSEIDGRQYKSFIRKKHIIVSLLHVPLKLSLTVPPELV